MKTKNGGHGPLYPDVHYGTEKQMLAWCKKEGITPRRDEEGNWDWEAAYLEYMNRPESGEKEEAP